MAERVWRSAHRVHVDASLLAVWDAIHDVTWDELAVTGVLWSLRNLPARVMDRRNRPGQGSSRTFVGSFLDAGFVMLREEPPRHLVAGAIDQPWRVRGGEPATFEPSQFEDVGWSGYVRVKLAFELSAVGDGTDLHTATTVTATDVAAARSFARYWTVVRLGSSVIRRDLLRAIAKRAGTA